MTDDDDRSDPAAPLEAYLSQWLGDDRSYVQMRFFGPTLTLGDLRRAVSGLRERTAEVEALRAELAVERARMDWLEGYRLGDNLDLMDEWDCDTLREAIDKAKGIEL